MCYCAMPVRICLHGRCSTKESCTVLLFASNNILEVGRYANNHEAVMLLRYTKKTLQASAILVNNLVSIVVVFAHSYQNS